MAPLSAAATPIDKYLTSLIGNKDAQSPGEKHLCLDGCELWVVSSLNIGLIQIQELRSCTLAMMMPVGNYGTYATDYSTMQVGYDVTYHLWAHDNTLYKPLAKRNGRGNGKKMVGCQSGNTEGCWISRVWSE